MPHRYKVRVYESGDQDGATAAGTLVLHIGGSSAIEAGSVECAKTEIQTQVKAGRLARGCVYQICAAGTSPEHSTAFTADLQGLFHACQLAAATGLYAEFRRIQFPSPEAKSTTPLNAM